MSPKNIATVSIAVVIVGIAVAVAIFVALPRQDGGNGATMFADGAGNNNSLTIISISGGSLAGGSKYLVSPNPFTGKGDYAIQDGGSDDSNPADGIIVVNGLRDGNFTVTQTDAPAGYARDKLSKIVEISASNGSATATFSSSPAGASNNQSSAEIKGIVYTAKFECGTISGNEGPLRPGHYDTDIGIFNKQEFPVKITWLAAASDGKNANTILKTVGPQSSTNIVCKDLRRAFGGEGFVEGFALIQVPLDPAILGTLSDSGTTIIGRTSAGEINLLDVQVFYTANALDELPHSVLVDKITFAIVNDTSGKIPQPLMMKTLDVSVPSNMSQISDPVEEVKQELAKKYSLTDQELAGLHIEIKGVDVGVGTMIDDHAVSLSRLVPQASS
ncbi:MAG TPA: prealbumin-like fold domain-containing protein [Nitrososphaera sp.]|jgi:hypothetical protein|nr:prealbumin-like fold domain-containing protein [Nitrososphaera sp.]